MKIPPLRLSFVWRFSALRSRQLPPREPFRYPEGRYDKGELRYINGIPVLTVGGSPEEIGEQIGVLALKPSLGLVTHFQRLSQEEGLGQDIAASCMRPPRPSTSDFPSRYRREIEAMIKASGADRDLVILGNTAFDL